MGIAGLGATVGATVLWAAACQHQEANATSKSNCVVCTATGEQATNENAACSYTATDTYELFCACKPNKNCDKVGERENVGVRDYTGGTCSSGKCLGGSFEDPRYDDFDEMGTADCPSGT